MKYTLEICAGTLRSALAAQEGGADRVELCDNLYEGGTTPSYGMIKICRNLLTIPFFPIIRPRGGDFVYSDQEFDVMKNDVLCCLELGCEGIVFGILQGDGNVDMERCSELVKLSGDMQLTFHRAFDRCSNCEKGLEDIIDLGFHRVLTSGAKEYAEEGIPELTKRVKQANNRINIMPGSGITSDNLMKIANETRAKEFHSTAKRKMVVPKTTPQSFRDTGYFYETDAVKVTEMRQLLDSIN